MQNTLMYERLKREVLGQDGGREPKFNAFYVADVLEEIFNAGYPLLAVDFFHALLNHKWPEGMIVEEQLKELVPTEMLLFFYSQSN